MTLIYRGQKYVQNKETTKKQRKDKKAQTEADILEEQLVKYELPEDIQNEKVALLADGFSDWNRKDYRLFVQACEKYGRKDKARIVQDVLENTGKERSNVEEYYKVFWERIEELTDCEKVLEKIERGEKKLERNQNIQNAIAYKVGRYRNPWQSLRINYGPNKGKIYTEEEDIYMLCMMNQIGYGHWEELKVAIRNAWQFRFDWFIKSRTPAELQRRCDTIIRLIEKEYEESEAARREEEKKSKSKKRKSSTAMNSGDSKRAR